MISTIFHLIFKDLNKGLILWARFCIKSHILIWISCSFMNRSYFVMWIFPFCQEPTYNPQVEAISPTLPPDETSPSSKDQLLQAISKVDREISKVDKDIQKLKKKQVIQALLYLR